MYIRMEKLDPTRTRQRNLVIRLNDRERDMLDVVATREAMSASETVRWLVRREYDRGEQAVPKAPKTTKGKRS